MRILFSKYDGAGNDFVVIDNRQGVVSLSAGQIAHVCHRRCGVGADGLLLLEASGEDYDFTMRYYNSDGHRADMCGNGGRCIAAFAFGLGLGKEFGGRRTLRFLADDGSHEAELLQWDGSSGVVALGMKDVESTGVEKVMGGWLLNTGVPHFVYPVEDLAHYDVVGEGRRLRHLPEMGKEGANVDFIEEMPDGRLMVRTYERGVEDETWACGTGVTACAIVTGNHRLCTRGGDFRVDFDVNERVFGHVKLTGPVSLNFTGTLNMAAAGKSQG